jgi:hypothetical protein
MQFQWRPSALSAEIAETVKLLAMPPWDRAGSLSLPGKFHERHFEDMIIVCVCGGISGIRSATEIWKR